MACLPECCRADRGRQEVITPVHGDSYAEARTKDIIYSAASKKAATIQEPESEADLDQHPVARPSQTKASQDVQQPPLSSSRPPMPPSVEDDVLTYEVAVERAAQGLGLDLSPHDGKTLLVGGVREGAVSLWNASLAAGAAEVVTRGDRLVAANDVGGSAEDLLAALRSDTTLVLTFCRRLLLTVRVRRKAGDELGLSWTSQDSCVISSVKEDSAAGRANRKHGPELELRPQDRILEVNGEQVVARFDEIMNSGQDLRLRVGRPALFPPSPARAGGAAEPLAPTALLEFRKPEGLSVRLTFTQRPFGFHIRLYRVPLLVGGVVPGSQARKLGVQLGWSIIAINGASVEQGEYADLSAKLKEAAWTLPEIHSQ